jgi:hypothetical protein
MLALFRFCATGRVYLDVAGLYFCAGDANHWKVQITASLSGVMYHTQIYFPMTCEANYWGSNSANGLFVSAFGVIFLRVVIRKTAAVPEIIRLIHANCADTNG